MNFCATFSESHRVFFEKYFLKTFPFSSNVSLIVDTMPQVCETGHLFAPGWRNQMIHKEEFIFKCLDRFKGEICVFCDVDICFYGRKEELYLDLVSRLKTNDICFLKDHGDVHHGRGAGFFALRSTPKMIAFFSDVLASLYDLSVKEKDKGIVFDTSEQGTINRLIDKRKNIKWDFLPEEYYTHGKYTNGIKNPKKPNGAWWEQKDSEEKKEIYIPSRILVHHANWCAGVANKIELLDFVRGRVYKKQGEKDA